MVCAKLVAALALAGAAPAARAGESVANDASVGGDSQRTRFVTVLSKEVRFGVRTLADPYRVIIDLSDVKLNLPPGTGEKGQGLVGGFRYGRVEPHGVRIVLDVSAPVRIETADIKTAGNGRPPRLVVEMVRTSREAFLERQRAQAAERRARANGGKEEGPSLAEARRRRQAGSEPVIVIDPGHGGIDPGAVSNSGTKEKDIVLAFCKTLRAKLRSTGRYDAILTRDGDAYLPLRERVEFARSKGAALFISVHADSLPARHAREVRGATVYTLSEEASDEEAKILAMKENRSDIIAGVDMPSESDHVANILIDLAQRETKNLSITLAETLLDSLDGKTQITKRRHGYAGFRVLKAPDVPSVLLELGYLSNRRDEKKLQSAKWRDKIAVVVVDAVDNYIARRIARSPY